MQEDWFAVFQFRVTVRAHLIKYDCFYHICGTADLFATRFNGMVHHHKLEYFVEKQIVVFKAKITVKVQNCIESLCILYLLYH